MGHSPTFQLYGKLSQVTIWVQNGALNGRRYFAAVVVCETKCDNNHDGKRVLTMAFADRLPRLTMHQDLTTMPSSPTGRLRAFDRRCAE